MPRDKLVGAVLNIVAALLGPPRNAVAETKALPLGAALREPAEQLLAQRRPSDAGSAISPG